MSPHLLQGKKTSGGESVYRRVFMSPHLYHDRARRCEGKNLCAEGCYCRPTRAKAGHKDVKGRK